MEQSNQEEQQRRVPRQKNFLWLVIVLGVAVSLIYGGYYFWKDTTEKISELESQTAKYESKFKHLQMNGEQIQKDIEEIQTNIQKANTAKNTEWQPLVVEYLIQMASLNLQTTGDVKLSISYLELAKQHANDQELSAVKQALDRDITNLKSLQIADPYSLITKLENLNHKINKLSFVPQNFVISKQKSSESTKAEETKSFGKLWCRFSTSVMNSLKDIVIVRHKGAEPLLLPEQEAVLRINLQTRLLQVELAVMQKQAKLYHVYLKDIENLVNKYFVVKDDTKKDLLSDIKELEEINLEPKLPTLFSWNAIQGFMKVNKARRNSKQFLNS